MSLILKCECEKNKIDLKHEPTPLELTKEMDEIIKRLLWYVPNINSAQSTPSDLLNNRLYENFLFDFVCKKMEFDVRADLIFNPEKSIMDTFLDMQNKEICVKCQQILLNKTNSETKITSLLRHLRNIIAHGDFIMVDDFFIGRDSSKDKEGVRRVSAFVKMYPQKLLEGLRQVNSPIFKEELIAYGFNNVGYEVNLQQRGNDIICDFMIEKNNLKFFIEIKNFKRQPSNRQIKEIINRFDDINNGYRVLICDEILILEELKYQLIKNNILLIDINGVERILSGGDVISSYIN